MLTWTASILQRVVAVRYGNPLGDVMTRLEEVENQAGLARVTCGWKLPDLPLEQVRRYWRDVHSPAIARRAGVYQYCHMPFDPVRSDLFAPIPGVAFSCPGNQQLMWQSDVRYRDQDSLEAFGRSPEGKAKQLLLSDIDLLVDQSTTYFVQGDCAYTYADRTGDPTPQGPRDPGHYGIFLRRRSGEPQFRDFIRLMCRDLAARDGVLRIRMNLFETPDIEAERKGGYPIKTHPPELQYQAWLDLVLEEDDVAHSLLAADIGEHVHTIHAYPVPAVYTFVYAGSTTLVGLRGYCAYEAIEFFDANHQRQDELLNWMYG
jgi:hypothetical protein